MKQTFALLLMLTLMISCKKDKDEDKSSSPYEQLVEGTWYLQTTDGVELSVCEKQSSVKFKTDGSVLSKVYMEGDGSCGDPNFTIDGLYTVDGNNIEINLGLGTSTGTFNISNGILTTRLTSSGVTTVDTYDRNPG